MSRVALVTAERVINHYVGQSTAAVELLESLDGKSFAIELEGIGAIIVLSACCGRLGLDSHADQPPSASISGTPLTLLSVLRNTTQGGLRASGAELTGDVETAESFARVLRLARPDLEEELARLFGDVAAHEMGSLVGGATEWGARASAAARMNVSEYLQEEGRQLPAPAEVEAFCREVERLRDDVERASYRMDRLLGKPLGPAAKPVCDESD